MFSFAKTDDDWLATGILGACFSFMLFIRLFKPWLFSYFFGISDEDQIRIAKQSEEDLDNAISDKIIGFNSGIR